MTTPTSTPANPYRLPTGVRPSHYDLTFEVDLDRAAFTGTVAARITVDEPLHEIVVNAAELDLAEAWVDCQDGSRIDATVQLDAETERATLPLAQQLAPGEATLHIRFAGGLNDKLHGFYRTTYTDHEGQERTAASTQFEATHARRAFPCWDEPAYKATFGITLVVPDDQLAISNAREIEREPLDDGRVRFRFADTIVMSTYLVAFVVGAFEATDAHDVRGTPLRVVHPIGQGHLAAFALEAGAFGLQYFADYYGIPYPGDKLDLVAVPDFAFGAMENLGCITFREVLLLVDPRTTTQPELQRVADVVFHELAHMWFGDLVTMKWWNGLWLNEAFATFMEMKCTDAFRPEWRRWVDFGLSRTAAFDTDSLASTRPIEFEVISPADAEGMFDILTYEKGAAVLRMIEQYLGEDGFRSGVRRYLETHAYANTETSDLWDAIEGETGQPVRAVADSWIFQGGYPLITAEQSRSGTEQSRGGAEQSGGEAAARHLTLSQEPFRYLTDGPVPATVWQIPLLLRAQGPDGEPNLRRVLLDTDRTFVDVDVPAGGSVLVNAGGHGFYRVRYGHEMLAALTARAQDRLAPIERYALVDDTYASLLAGHTDVGAFLDLARGLADDDDLSVWQRLAAALASLSRLLDGDDLTSYQKIVRDLAGPALDIAGWEPADGESDRQRELRATLFTLLGTVAEDPAVLQRARELQDRVLAASNGEDATGSITSTTSGGVDPSLAAAALNVVAAHGDASDYETFLERSTAAGTPQEQRRYLYSLADFRIDDLIERTLERCRNGEVRSQDAPFVVGRVLTNRYEARLGWDFVTRHWEELNERFPSNTIVRMLAPIATFTDEALAGQVAAFFAEHRVPQGAKTLAQHLEKLQVNVALAKRERDSLRRAVR